MRVEKARVLRFFAGKGGVGKTTLAAAAAARLAARGANVLLVSLDPAHSLGDALATKLGPAPRRIPTKKGRLFAVELDADRALARWLRARKPALGRIVERGTYLAAADVDRLLGLSLPGVDEIHALSALVALADRVRPDEVVVDTAPTGHTLRLLATPDALAALASALDRMHEKHRLLSLRLAGVYREDAADALVRELASDAERLSLFLRDPSRVRFSWVTNAEPLAVEETIDGVGALHDAGISVSEIVVNRLTRRPKAACARCGAAIRSEHASVLRLERAFPLHDMRFVRAQEPEPRGIAAVARLGHELAREGGNGAAPRPARVRPAARSRGPGAEALAGALAGARLVFFGGKGGVGKTTCAATTALAIAASSPRRRVLLLSVDPAHSLGDVLDRPVGDAERAIPGAPKGLRVREIDAGALYAERRERYQEAVADIFDALRRRAHFDATHDREVVSGLVDVAPPGLDEICAVLTVVDVLFPSRGRARHDVVLLDTAPTGHTLRLLAMPGAAHEWVRTLLAILLEYREAVGLPEFASDLVELGRQLRALRALLEDPDACTFVAVSRPTALARLETARLVRALGRAKVRVGALVVNGGRGPDATCPSCRRVAKDEAREKSALSALAKGIPVFEASEVSPPPRGVPGLRRWGARWRRSGEA